MEKDGLVYITQLDSVYLRISCNESIANEINDYFTFDAPNAKFNPAYRKRHWDGKIRLFSKQTGKLNVGLLFHFMEFCHNRKYSYTIDSSVYIQKDKNDILPTKNEIREFYTKLNIHSKNKPITPRDYQIDGLHHAICAQRSLIVSPTGSR